MDTRGAVSLTDDSCVNLILFEATELDQPLALQDPRAVHLLKVLRRAVGDTFDAGLVNGPRGKGTLTSIHDDKLSLGFIWEPVPDPLPPLIVIAGLPRPQTARDILRDGTSLGASELHFIRTDKGEPGYAQSTLWTTGEWRRLVWAGAEQAFETRIPAVTHGRTLADVLTRLPTTSTRLALDNYEATAAFSACVLPPEHPPVLALGGERGWSDGERGLLRAHGFQLVHLGSRPLRTEVALVAAITLTRAKLGLM
jgi:16S rRNA (uracil1498-N3)-methyltransferase